MAKALMTKVVIMARGLGTRMRKSEDGAQLTAEQAKVAETGVKAMIPIDRPFLDYVLNDLADAGYTDVCLIIGPEHQAVREYYNKLNCQRLNIHFAVQEKPLGTANAVVAAEAFAGDDPFLVINSDNYYPHEALSGLRKIEGNGLAEFDRDSMFKGSNIDSDRLTKFAVIEKNDKGQMTRILEKPDAATLARLPEPIGVSMNCWRFTKSIFSACRAIPPSARGEYEITDAVQFVIDNLKEPFLALTVKAPVLDMSSRGDVASVTKKLKGKGVAL